MTDIAKKTREEIVAELSVSWNELIEVAERRLSAMVLVGQGFICVLESDGMMGIGYTEDQKGYRLRVLTGYLTGVLHHTQSDANTLAAHWNAGLNDEQQSCRVKVVHYREALQTLITTAKEQLDWMANGFPQAEKA